MMQVENYQKYKLPKMVIKTDGYEVPFGLYKLETVLAKLGLADQSETILAELLKKLGHAQVVKTTVIYDELLSVLKKKQLHLLLYINLTKKTGLNKLIQQSV